MSEQNKKGAALLESTLLVPLLVLLLVGGMEFGKITLTYYTLHKAVRGAARMAGLLRGGDFCNAEDTQLAAIRNFVVYGPEGAASAPLVRDFTPDQIVFTPERLDPLNPGITDCGCAGADGCSPAEGGRAPDFIRVSIDSGYPFQPRIPFRTLDTILLRPNVRVPFGGQ